MRRQLVQWAAAAVAALASVAAHAPLAVPRCDDAAVRAHACCCRGGLAQAPMTAVPDAAPQSSATATCCTANEAPAPASPAAANEDDCRCIVRAPALPFGAPRITVVPTAPVAFTPTRVALPAQAGLIAFLPIPSDDRVHAPPEVGRRVPRGPPLRFSSSVA